MPPPLKPQLRDELAQLVAIPSISAPGYPEETHAALGEAYEEVARLFEDAGMGTVVAIMLPYMVILSVLWTVLFVAWYLFRVPLGPGAPVKLLDASRVSSADRRRPAPVWANAAASGISP